MRELDKELKELRLYGMAGAWEDLVKQGGQATLESSRWPRRPPKVLHLWPPKLLHPGRGDLTH